MKIKCELYCGSNSPYLQQLYTGFRLLEQQRKIELSYHINKNQITDIVDHANVGVYLQVKLNNTKLLLFDTKDFGTIQKEVLDRVDFLFKRSFSSSIIGPELAYKKVFPLGLAFVIYEKYPSWFSLSRLFLEEYAGEKVWSIIRKSGMFSWAHPRLYRLHNNNCGAEPDLSLPAGVIYMARLWEPLNPKYRSSTEAINIMRVDCIRKLKKEFGSRFMGGLEHSEYSARYFPDCLYQDSRLSAFGNCMRLLRQYPIGVETTGLHDSIGWKFGEYMAFSRAIVSEKLNFEAPGLERDKHYLEFTTSDECVEAVLTLMNDKDIRQQMMIRNHEYYQTYVRPDMVVWNALSAALEHSDNIG